MTSTPETRDLSLNKNLKKLDSVEESSIVDKDDTNSNGSHTEKHSSCHNVKVFLALMCFFSITQGFAINGVNNVNIPMYERRFGLSSTQTGLIASFYDITAGCSVLLAGYFATQFHQPRLIGLASLTLAFGSLSMALPHFTTGYYEPGGTKHTLCYVDGNSTTNETCGAENRELPDNLYVLLLGQGMHGLAGTVLYAIAPAYIDGSVSSRHSPAYLGLFYGSSALGPAIGYIVGGQMLDLYVDYPHQPPDELTMDSPAWVGAWWLGFLMSFTSCFVLAFPLCTFPNVLPGTEKRRRDNVSQAHDHGKQHKADQSGFGMSIRDIPAALWLLLKNPVFICQCLIGAVEGFIVSGLSTFLPKFIANQFNQKASWAAMLTGFIAVPGAAFGQFLGGYLVHRFNMKIRGILKFNMGCSVLIIILVTVFWAKCDQGNIAGVNIKYDGTEISGVNLTSSCNSGCGCDTSVYDPVCLQEVQYFTACHAGCAVKDEKPDTKSKVTYSDCNCAAVYNQSSYTTSMYMNESMMNEAPSGKCETDCIMLYVFIPVAFFIMICVFMMAVPGTTIVLRSVNDKQRTFALSIQQMCMRFLGTIPGPLVFGTILDTVCQVWQTKCDNSNGSCWIYNSEQMGLRFYIVVVIVKVITLTLLVTAYCLYKPPATQSAATNNSETTADETGKENIYIDTKL